MPVAPHLIERAHALVFDLDGTLVDTFEDLWLALNSCLAQHGLRSATRADLQSVIHLGLDETVRAIVEQRGIDPAQVPALIQTYRAHYRQRAHAASQLYPGVIELLNICRQRGQLLAVCTNKLAADAHDLLAHLGIAACFSLVTGIDTYGIAKPDPAPLHRTLQRLGCPADAALFVGDSIIDALCARDAGVPFVLHTAGYGAAEAEALGCGQCFHDYSALLAGRSEHATRAPAVVNR